MPELRTRARRYLASINPNPNSNPIDILPQPDSNTGKNKFTVRFPISKQKDAIVAAAYDSKLSNNDKEHTNTVNGVTPLGRK
ncbi:hypothetical protein HRI_002925700 [Hibiscus trionum]|uniref:Uncharacterized protein n=1 Tax=Hibiscus trionum TaxID=183268 RepID=A0A9W7I8N7_HIBTR|nr:hypothetical protein HRI_002925700 [Hibiscus trionum]